ncbi:MAG TPA: flavodoxin domain-containing protein [Polyangiaceae bacterium]|nr:flavodoxin domain-containing protein [Polyangiaceae bacterium]
MKPLLILYGTREGHTRRIAEHVASTATRSGVPAICRDVETLGGEIDFNSFAAIVLAGSIHAGKYPAKLVKLVRDKRDALERLPTLLLTVCLAQAGIEKVDSPPEKRTAAAQAVQAMVDEFIEKTGFRPTRTQAVAGALPYTQYNFFIRWIMKRIVAKEGGDTDTSRDYVYTDWSALEQLTERFLTECGANRSEEITVASVPRALAG